MTTDTARGHPLIVTADERLLDDLLRLSAAAGASPDVATDATSVRRLWPSAAAVLLGDDLLAEVARSAPGRRDDVIVIAGPGSGPGWGPGADASWAETRGAETRWADTRWADTRWADTRWAAAVAVGAAAVWSLPDDQSQVVDLLGDCLDGRAVASRTLAVLGGCGGAGASTLAAGLGLAGAARGWSSLLVDVDPLGGGIDLTVGSERADGLRWPDLTAATGRIAATTLSDALPRADGLGVLSWDRSVPGDLRADSVRSVLAAARRGHDLVVLDLPRRLDAPAEEALLRSSSALLVVPARVRAVAAAARMLPQLRDSGREISLVVRVRGAGLDPDSVADTLALPLIATMRDERGLGDALDEGVGPLRRRRGPLARTCADLLDALVPTPRRVA